MSTPPPFVQSRPDRIGGAPSSQRPDIADGSYVPTPAPQAAGKPRSPLTALLPIAAPPAAATASKAEAEVVAATPAPAAPPPQIPFQAAASVGPVKVAASGPDVGDVLLLLAGAGVVGFGGWALISAVAAANQRAAARERREDRLVAEVVRTKLALKAARKAAKGGQRGRV